MNQANGTVATSDQIDDALNPDVGTSLTGTPLVLGAAILSLNSEKLKKEAEQGECSAAEKAIVHQFAASWVPVEHCYPLKFIDTLGDLEEEVPCVTIAKEVLDSELSEPLPSVVAGYTSDSDIMNVRKGFKKVVSKFKYQVFSDDPDITSECTAHGTILCSSAAASLRPGGSCLETTDTNVAGQTFPARQSCLNEFKKNLADIALWLDNGRAGFTGSPANYGQNDEGNDILDVFKETHVRVMGAGTENALNKLKA